MVTETPIMLLLHSIMTSGDMETHTMLLLHTTRYHYTKHHTIPSTDMEMLTMLSPPPTIHMQHHTISRATTYIMMSTHMSHSIMNKFMPMSHIDIMI